MILNPYLEQTVAPGIAEINALADRARAQGRRLLNAGQAVPDYPPPAGALAALMRRLSEPSLHRYTPDPGRRELREAWAAVLRQRFGHPIDAEAGLLITAGANQAYLMAVMAVLPPGGAMGLLTPCYFNHAMAVTLTGGRVVPLPRSSAEGFALDPERVLTEVRRRKLQAVTVVTPCNPTGITCAPAALAWLAAGLARLGVWLLVDETYGFFADSALGHTSGVAASPAPERVITIGSFSKTFALAGWRVGYLAAAPAVVGPMLKIQDTMVICASHPAQELVRGCLTAEGWRWLARHRRQLARRRERLRAAATRFEPWRLVSAGAFFAWLEGPAPGRATAYRLLAEQDLITIPGDVFQCAPAKRSAPGAIRFSYGGLPDRELDTAIGRLAQGLAASCDRRRQAPANRSRGDVSRR